MKKNFIKKLVLNKLTVANLDAEKMKTVRGGRMPDSERDCGGNDWTYTVCGGWDCPTWPH
jgi:natural product precursor